MKIATLAARHGLTLSQYAALSGARGMPLYRVGPVWRSRRSMRALRRDVVERLVEKGALEIQEERAHLTDRGRTLLQSLEGLR